MTRRHSHLKTLFDFEMRGYQRYITRKCHEIPFICVAVDMSLGKTAAVLTFLEQLWEDRDAKRVLVVAPKRVATDTWPDEIARWRHLRHLEYSVICGTPAERMKALRNKRAYIHIINKENLQWLYEVTNDGRDLDYDVLVIDEASMLKEGKKRTKRAGGGKGSRPLSRFGILAKIRDKVERVIEMTGTPAPEGVHNMWGLMYILDRGERLGHNKTAFEMRWFDKGYMGWDMKPRPGAQEQIMERAKDLMISLRAEDHIKLPPVVTTPDTDIWVTLPRDIMSEYRHFERELFTDRYDVEAASNGVLVNKLLQFANGSLYRENGKDIHVHDLKLDALQELVDDMNGHPLIVAYSFQFDARRIKARFGKKCVLVEEAGRNLVKDWNTGKIKLLVTHPASLSHGMNLQFGGFNACWYGVCHSGELYKQFNMRLPRPGQKAERVYIRHILARGTWDAKVLANQQRKDGVESAIRRAVRVTKEDIEMEMRRAA